MIAERTSEGKAEKKATDPDYKEGRKIKEAPDFAEFFKKRRTARLRELQSAQHQQNILV